MTDLPPPSLAAGAYYAQLPMSFVKADAELADESPMPPSSQGSTAALWGPPEAFDAVEAHDLPAPVAEPLSIPPPTVTEVGGEDGDEVTDREAHDEVEDAVPLLVEVFPLLVRSSRFSHGELLLPSSPVRAADRERLFAALFEEFSNSVPAPLHGDVFPLTSLSSGEELLEHRFGRRPYNCMLRASIRTWADLRGKTAIDLMRLANFGTLSLEAVVRESMERSLELADSTRRVSVGVPTDGVLHYLEVDESSDAIRQVVTDLLDAIGWASRDRAASTLGELLTVRREAVPLPPRVAGLLERALATEILLPGNEAEVSRQLGLLLDGFEERDRYVIESRVLPVGVRPTLEEVGQKFGITRERVRQLERRLTDELTAQIAAEPLRALNDRAAELRIRLGDWCLNGSERYQGAIHWATRDVAPDEQEFAESLLVWMAGPYEMEGRWLHRAGTRSSTAIAAEIHDAVESAGGATGEPLADDVLSDAGVAAAEHAAWLVDFSQLEPIDGATLLTTGNVIDLVVRYLRFVGEPLEPEDILRGINRDSMSVRSVRQRLFESPQLHRVTKSKWALTEWGLDPYTSVPEEMLEEIERRGGSVKLDELVQTLAERHDIAPTSVRMYAARPMFKLSKDGTVSVRAEGDSYEAPTDLSKVAGCIELSPDVAAWRVKVDSDILRGSGRRVPEPLLGWLGVAPGQQLDLYHAEGVIPVSWRAWGQPSIGSLKMFSDRFGSSAGDWLVLRLTRPDRLAVSPVSEEPSDGYSYAHLAALLGIPDADDPLRSVAGVLGVDPDADNLTFRIRGVLVARGEEELVAVMDKVMFG